MKLTIFQSDEGDCLLLEGGEGGRVLCDGGMGPSMRSQVRHELCNLPDLDFIYISHIDEDHIGGVLQLLQDEVEWRVFHRQQERGEETKRPESPQPPRIHGLLYNTFHDLLGSNAGNLSGISLTQEQQILHLLEGLAPSLAATGVKELAGAASEMLNITNGVPNAIRITKLAADNALDIPLNRPPGVSSGSKLLYAGQPGEKFTLGGTQFTLIGPTQDELKDLREGWNNWLRANKTRLRNLRAELKKRVEEFSNGNLNGSPFDLSTWEGVPGHEGVTVPNIASLMWMVEEEKDGQRKRLLLTGDGQEDFILAGLRRTGFLGPGKSDGLHLDVLKVQHHGSPNNLDKEFARKVSADHYVFCGNGEHHNPSTDVIEWIYNSRLGSDPKLRALAPEAQDREFHFWFSTTSAAQTPNTAKRRNFKKVEAKVARLVEKSKGKLHAHFNQATSIVLTI
jgi:beta-lactamase superfamily II metal-dependent hydrolase